MSKARNPMSASMTPMGISDQPRTGRATTRSQDVRGALLGTILFLFALGPEQLVLDFDKAALAQVGVQQA